MLRVLSLLFVVACASGRTAPPAKRGSDAAVAGAHVIDAASIDAAPVDAPADAPIDAGPRLLHEGEVCRKGGPRGALEKERACEHGLHCCHPCGIQGCDHICKRVCINAP